MSASLLRLTVRMPMRLSSLLALALVLAACGKDRDGAAPLAFAPADTPYVFANLEPMPDAVIDSWSKLMTPVQAAYAAMLEEARAKIEQDDDPEKARRTLAVMELFQDKLSLEGWERIGFTRKGRMALYGVGVLPVLRVELGDPDALRAFFAEIERRTQTPLPVAQIDDHSYWRFAPEADKPFAIVAAIIDKHLVVTLDVGSGSTPLADLLGLDAPKNSLADGEQLAQVNRDYGFGPYGTFLFDSRRFIAALLGSEGQDGWFAGKLAAEGKPLTPPCRTEFAGLAELMPRIVAGYTRLDGTHMDSNTIFELKPALVDGLQPLAAPVPGLGDGSEPAFDFGFGIKLDKLAEFMQAQAQAVRAAPYACEHLAALNDTAEQTGQQVAGLYMAAGWFTGLRAVLTEFAWSEGAEKPERVEGAVVLASPNPASLIGMVQGFVPQLSQIQLTPGAPPQPLPLSEMNPQLAELPPAYAAMTDTAIGLAVGESAQAELPARLAAPAGQPAPLFYMGYSGPIYARFFQQLQALGKASAAGEEKTEAELEAERMIEPMMGSLYAIYNAIAYTSMSFVVTERGVEMRQAMRLN